MPVENKKRLFAIVGRHRAILSTALLLFAQRSPAQFSQYEHTNVAAQSITPLSRLLNEMNNILFGSYDYFYADQQWDSARRHYTGRLPRYFYYPEIARAGYRGFAVVKVERSGIDLGESLEKTVEQSEDAVRRDKRRTKQAYYYDSSGWLRAITAESIYPGCEGYSETRDSFFYGALPDGSLRDMRWHHREASSGSCYSGTIYCPPMPPRHHVRKTSVVTFDFDSFQNLTRLHSRNEELWDTCAAGGPKNWERRLWYDTEGKLVRYTDSSTPFPVPTQDYRMVYETAPFPRFAARVKDSPMFAAFRNPEVQAWLKAQGGLTHLALRKTSTGYTVYDPQIREQRLRLDSPTVSTDSAFFLINHSRQRVASWYDHESEYNVQNSLAFYFRNENKATDEHALQIQYLSFPQQAPESKLPQNPQPLLLSGVHTRRNDKLAAGSDMLHRYATTENVANQSYYHSNRPSNLQFTSAPPDASKVPVAAAALTDEQGLVRYIWLPHHVFKLTYF